MSDRSDERKVAEAARTLELLEKQAVGLRAELAKLQLNLADAQRAVSAARAAELLEANEKLLLAALHAEAIAETAVRNLDALTRSSQHDALTDTPNRALTLDKLEHAIALARRHGTRVAVLFLDVDHFKQINDTLGHAGGDEVLQLVARRLESAVRESDTISRHGGDEFLALVAEISQASDAALIAAKMLSALAAPVTVGEHVLRLSASLGIAIFPEDGEDAASLIRGADAAMYQSKRAGGGTFTFHEAEIPLDRASQPSVVAGRPVSVTRGEHPQPDHASRLPDLREANERLVIAALTAQELEAHAEEAHRRQIRFMATVAHELRNPLSPIRTAARLLHRARTDEPLLAQLQSIIERQVVYMSKLVEDLLDGSRASTGKLRLECSTIDIIDVLGVAVQACQAAMDARLQRMTMQLPPGPLAMQGDSVRLIQVFTNLLDNASRYTPDGGEIVLAVALQDHTITITISDNGIGITAQALTEIFDLFVQETRALRHQNRGLGVGLAVVRELVQAHGGTIVGRSAGHDLGSEFIVTLPLAGMPAALRGDGESLLADSSLFGGAPGKAIG